MKRSAALDEITYILDTEWDLENISKSELILKKIEWFMSPKRYISPKAMEEFGSIIKERGEHWGYINYIDKYPEYHFPKGRPYDFYLNGWEPEDETF